MNSPPAPELSVSPANPSAISVTSNVGCLRCISNAALVPTTPAPTTATRLRDDWTIGAQKSACTETRLEIWHPTRKHGEHDVEGSLFVADSKGSKVTGPDGFRFYRPEQFQRFLLGFVFFFANRFFLSLFFHAMKWQANKKKPPEAFWPIRTAYRIQALGDIESLSLVVVPFYESLKLIGCWQKLPWWTCSSDLNTWATVSSI